MNDKELRAREAIRDLLARYNMAGDAHDIESFTAVFVEDARFSSAAFLIEGRAAIRSWFEERVAKADIDVLARHNLGTCLINFTGAQKAEARTYFTVFSNHGADHGGVYQDRFVCNGAEWFIKEREVVLDWVHSKSALVPKELQKF